MSKFKYQDLIKASLIYAGLFLSPEPSKAMEFEESNLIGLKKPTRPKHDWEDKKPQGKTRKEDYNETRDMMMKKYGYHREKHRVPHQGPSLVELSKEFVVKSNRLREEKEKDLEEVNTFGKQFVDGVGDVAEITIEEGVKDTKTQNSLKRLKGKVVNELKTLFN